MRHDEIPSSGKLRAAVIRRVDCPRIDEEAPQ